MIRRTPPGAGLFSNYLLVLMHLKYAELNNLTPVIDYKNVSLLKKYMSENNKILSSKITSVSSGKQKKLTKEIKKAKILGLI